MNAPPVQYFAEYQTALLALIVLALIVLLQSFIGALLGFVKGKETPGVALTGNHADLGFRALRCYQNGVENLPAFAIALFVAIFAGASPSSVNTLAVLHLALRVIYGGLYYAGIGKPAGGPRSIAYVLGWAVNIVLVTVAIKALL